MADVENYVLALAATWTTAVLCLGVRLARLEWARARARIAHLAKRSRDAAADDDARPRPAAGGGWTVAAGERWEGAFWWREADALTHADAGQARVYAGWGERHVGALCVKVAPRGGQLHNDRVVWSALHAAGGFGTLGGGLPRLHAHLRCVGADGRDEALVSELCGRSIAWHLRARAARAACAGARAALAPADALLVGAELLRLVGCCHALGYAHRDVTPANVLTPAAGARRSADGSLLSLVDFGIAERLPAARGAAGGAASGAAGGTADDVEGGASGWARGAARAQDRSGTLRFATPHIGRAPLAPRDDVLGACFVLCACAAGELPWDGACARAAAQGAAAGVSKAKALARATRARAAREKLRFLREAARAGNAGGAGGAGGADDERESDGGANWWALLESPALREGVRACVAAAASLGVTDVPDYAGMAARLLEARALLLGARAAAAEAARGAPELQCVAEAGPEHAPLSVQRGHQPDRPPANRTARPPTEPPAHQPGRPPNPPSGAAGPSADDAAAARAKPTPRSSPAGAREPRGAPARTGDDDGVDAGSRPAGCAALRARSCTDAAGEAPGADCPRDTDCCAPDGLERADGRPRRVLRRRVRE
ncbi:hypothetical protein KFE25_004344 [Diacronema lutheri]|uniref:Protein kinase domain-containing protein n=1 Tax=Diacronema lutheri TaxID=2081491 RepID=A0A8J6C4N4_DIALT|nr:hypothetical protein KFE25_004344 [Diacronema lutheri]